MRNRFVYFSLSLAAALAALITQFTPPSAVAQRQPPPNEPSAECVACEESCNLSFEACIAERGSRGPGRGQCTRALQECRQTCNGRGGACHPQADSTPGDTPPPPTSTPSPTPSPTPD